MPTFSNTVQSPMDGQYVSWFRHVSSSTKHDEAARSGAKRREAGAKPARSRREAGAKPRNILAGPSIEQ